MIGFIRKSLANEYGAALEMLRSAIERCDDANWNKPVGRFPFWHVAYHVLFYTDLYLSANEKTFERQPFCGEGHQFFGKEPWPPHMPIVIEKPYDKPTLLKYAAHCIAKAAKSIAAETEESLRGESGFWWYKIPRLDFHINDIRHVQHHAGALCAFLWREQGKGADWAGSKAL